MCTHEQFWLPWNPIILFSPVLAPPAVPGLPLDFQWQWGEGDVV